jgi:hypothetical protein
MYSTVDSKVCPVIKAEPWDMMELTTSAGT